MFHCLNVNKFVHPFTYERASCLLEAELIFVKGVKSVSRFFLHLRYSVVPASFVEETILAPAYCFNFFVRDELTIFMDRDFFFNPSIFVPKMSDIWSYLEV